MAATAECALLFFVKYPTPGQVKTRLAAEVGAERAAEIYRRLVSAVCARLPLENLSLRVCFDPVEQGAAIERWLHPLLTVRPQAETRFIPQCAGDLGDRMCGAFAQAFSEGAARVAVIGSDCVEITAGIIEEAFRALDRHDCAIGPSADGGYYLLALRRPQPELFERIAWSTPETFRQTSERAAELGLKVALLPELCDVDTESDWKIAERFLASAEHRMFPNPFTAKSPLDAPLVFEPLYMERVWGGRRLEAHFGRKLPGNVRIGESWELVDREEAQSVVHRGALRGTTLHELWTDPMHREGVFGKSAPETPRFPLLFKLLDAQERLSVQVHPPAPIAGELGGEPKTEMWYVVENYGEGDIFAGLNQGVTREEFERSLRDGTVAEKVHRVPVKAGDSIFIPSGRIHAIGAGNVIVEVQQNSDTTYRVFDWNRLGLDGKPRALHIEESMRSIDFDDFEPAVAAPIHELVAECEFFRVEKWQLSAARAACPPGEFAIFTVLSGSVRCAGMKFGPGDFFLVPATLEDRALEPAGEFAELLRTTLPEGDSKR